MFKGCKLLYIRFKRLRATAGQGPNYVGPCCGYVGLCWRMLAYLAGNVGPSCGYVGLCWPHVDPCWAKRSEKWEQPEKHCKTQDIVMVGGLSWGYVGLSWGQCGPILGLCWPILGLCWPILELCWPILGLCWPILGAMLPQLGAMLAHLEAYVGPCWPILNHKIRKMRKMRRAQNTVKRGTFWPYRVVGGRGGGPSLLRRGENCRTAMPRPGGPWPDLRAAAPAADPGKNPKSNPTWNPTETQKKPEIKPLRDVKLFCSILSCLYPKWNFKDSRWKPKKL